MPRISCTKPEQFLVDCGRPNIRVSINFDHFKSKQLKGAVIYCFKPENDCNLSNGRENAISTDDTEFYKFKEVTWTYYRLQTSRSFIHIR